MDKLKPCRSNILKALNSIKGMSAEETKINTEFICETAKNAYALINNGWGKAPKTNSRPAPQNKPLTLDQLREMDGEPVWIVEAPDWGHWELSVDAEDYLDDRDPDFYGMRHDDPAGRYGLHALGWLAYAHKPDQEAAT